MRLYLIFLLILGSCGDSMVRLTDKKPKSYYYVKDDKPTLCENMVMGGKKYWTSFTSKIEIIDEDKGEYHQACNDGITPLVISRDLKFSDNNNTVIYNDIKHEFGKKLAPVPSDN